MSSRKRRRKEQAVLDEGRPESPSSPAGASPVGAPADPEAEVRAQQVISVVGFAFVGLLMGFLTGANHQVATATSQSSLVQATLAGVALALQTTDLVRGLGSGFMGLVVGGTFGYSLFLAPGMMFMAWLGGALGLAAGLATGVSLLAGVGWAGGFGIVLFGVLKHRPGSGP